MRQMIRAWNPKPAWTTGRCVGLISDTTDLGGHMVVPQQDECARHEHRRATAVGSAGSDNAAALGTADVVCLAAAPTFAMMALLTGVLGGSVPDMLCSAMHDASPLSGMVLMYLLMSSFHTAPWLKLIAGRWSDASRCGSGVCQIERQRSRREVQFTTTG